MITVSFYDTGAASFLPLTDNIRGSGTHISDLNHDVFLSQDCTEPQIK